MRNLGERRQPLLHFGDARVGDLGADDKKGQIWHPAEVHQPLVGDLGSIEATACLEPTGQGAGRGN